MALLEVLRFPDPRLQRPSEPVTAVTAELLSLAQDMLETMYKAPGVGLAANQVGVSQRLVVIDVRRKTAQGLSTERLTELEKKLTYPLILFNPEILERKNKTTFEEGCLSVPGYVESVTRSEWVRARVMNADGELMEFEADGLLAICLQHEIDHLDGRLFIDRLSLIRRNLLRAQIKKHGYPEAAEHKSLL